MDIDKLIELLIMAKEETERAGKTYIDNPCTVDNLSMLQEDIVNNLNEVNRELRGEVGIEIYPIIDKTVTESVSGHLKVRTPFMYRNITFYG